MRKKQGRDFPALFPIARGRRLIPPQVKGRLTAAGRCLIIMSYDIS